MKNPIIATESFSENGTHYFFDFMQAVNGSYYLRIVRSDQQPDNTYLRTAVVFFEQNFELAIQALSTLFSNAARYEAQKTAARPAPETERTTGIKSWEPALRPREKMAEQGRDAMADAELLAMLIGSGSPRETAVELADRILASVDYDLKRLSELTAEDLCRFHGMGQAKALSIISSMELAARLVKRQNKTVWLKAL
jgi:DNA repair protein RadC